jgi:hypothetical protein
MKIVHLTLARAEVLKIDKVLSVQALKGLENVLLITANQRAPNVARRPSQSQLRPRTHVCVDCLEPFLSCFVGLFDTVRPACAKDIVRPLIVKRGEGRVLTIRKFYQINPIV